MPVANPEDLVGTDVGRYRLEKILGEGGMGVVYLGVDAKTKARVAIKVLSKQTEDSMTRFRAEARAVSLISHANIVNLVDVAELSDGRPYMVMELVEGQSLRDAAPASTVGTIARICSEALAALEAAHAIGIVHRDLKPDNIMVTKAGHAKVLDFGVAKLAPGVGGGLTPRTKEGLTMGTPAYMAPEQVVGGAVDARTDVYTMGVVLFEALTGQRPFNAGAEVDIMRAHRDRPPPKPRSLVPTIPAAVEDVILRALEKDPAKRYQSASAMAVALDDAVAGRPSAKRVDTSNEATPRERPAVVRPSAAAAAPSRWPAMIAVAAIAIAATVVFVIARTRRNAHRAPADAAVIVADAAEPDATEPIDARAEVPVVADAATDLVDAAVADASVDRAPPKQALPAPIKRPPDFSTDAFEPLAYVPSAAALARQLASDAQLVEIVAGPVITGNVIELARAKRHVEYRYVSAEGAKAPQLKGGHPCMVVVTISPAGSTPRVETDPRCSMKPIHTPRCSLAQLKSRMESAYASDYPRDVEFSIVFRGRWIVYGRINKISEVQETRVEMPDDC